MWLDDGAGVDESDDQGSRDDRVSGMIAAVVPGSRDDRVLARTLASNEPEYVWADGRSADPLLPIEEVDGNVPNVGVPQSDVTTAGSYGQVGSLGNIVAGVRLPEPASRPLWACNHCGVSTHTTERWYDALVGVGCDEASRMAVMALGQYSQGGWIEANAIVDTAVTATVIRSPSAYVWSQVDDAFKRVRPHGAQYAGVAGTR